MQIHLEGNLGLNQGMKKSYILAQYRLHADHDTPHIAHPSGTAAAVWSPGAVMSPPHDIFTTRCTILPSVLHHHSYSHFKAPFKVYKSTNHWCILNSVLPDKVENTFAPAPDLSLTWRRVRTAAVTCLQQLHPAVWTLGTLGGGITGASGRQNAHLNTNFL